MNNLVIKTSIKLKSFMFRKKMEVEGDLNNLINNKRGAVYLDELIKIAMVIVIGGVIMASLYFLIKSNALPKVSDMVMQMFEFKGN
jgi:hypothetical protein|nr:DUF6133 family protein [Clostridioides sp.]